MNLKPKSNKDFWKAVNDVSRSKSAIQTQIQDDVVITTDKGKSEAFSTHFPRRFNYSVPPLAHHNCHISASDEISDLLCSEEEVEYLLSSLDASKATGPDGISGSQQLPVLFLWLRHFLVCLCLKVECLKSGKWPWCAYSQE